MDLFFWLTVSFIVIGFVVFASTAKGMERKVALIRENEESMVGKQISNKPVIWWIVGATAFGLVSMFLVVRSFSIFM
ncbi:hypothetical protein [Sporosarcina sp. 6E9]|uniref:hypothetical protein n=1 Tax=Sporosarcina sp. 6E9 TaxID=2819235 RepID=UPI001ACC7256|nr:hypothetical protein [Sporosarcina sp. 6E9]MBO1912277.1 hypothetical protein [Microvirga sp. 3-52]